MIEINGLVKRYGSFLALNDVNLKVASGGIFGFIGPNGAGKTTTIKILSTLIYNFEGEVLVDGYDIKKNYKDIRRLIGYMPDYVFIYKNMTVLEYLEFFADAYGIKNPTKKNVINDCLELTDLHNYKKKIASQLSRGMTQRLLLAKTLVHNPKLLLLDEPASGLDPRARIEFKEIIKTLKDMDKTIFISSHILSELSDVCNSVGIIETGKIVTYGMIDDIRRLMRKNSAYLMKSCIKFSDSQLEFIETLENVARVKKVDGWTVDIEVTGKYNSAAEILKQCCDHNIKVVGYKEIETNLEDIFMKITKGIVS